VIVPDPNFRPNPNRAVYIQGFIDQGTVDRLTPQILKLTSQNRDPITVYIDSRGGSVASAELILRLLQATNQDGASPCWLITVVTSRAASAAADLLSSGNYAIAYPESTILYHGVRTSLNELTVEIASLMAESLKISNDRYAMALARKSEWRFMWRFMSLRSGFGEHREKIGKPKHSELDCFIDLISAKLSGNAAKILTQAHARYQRYNALISHFLKLAVKSKRFMEGSTEAHSEGLMLRAIINFEVRQHKADPEWNFRDGGLVRLTDNFYLLQEYLASARSEQFRKLCDRWGAFVLTDADKAELEGLAEPEKTKKQLDKVRPYFQPFWSFFVALCHALQEGENELTAVDAFWLGLIDEIIGMTSLPLTRFVAEYQPDPQPAQVEPPIETEPAQAAIPAPTESTTLASEAPAGSPGQ
jgi:ATP-dependent protease ClpP protease subunit